MKQNNFLGVIGSFLGALIGTIPLILIYAYGGNLLLSVLALPIAFLSYKGYTLLKGKIGEHTWILILIMSLFSITSITFIVIPLIKIKAGISLNSLIAFYQNDIIVKGLIGDYILSLIFTVLGLSFLLGKLMGQASDCGFDINSNDYKNIINVFKKHDAISSKKAVSLKEIEAEITVLNKEKIILELKKRKILLGKNKMYLDKEKLEVQELEEIIINKKKQRSVLVITIAVIFLLVLYIVLYFLGGNFKSPNSSNGDYKNYEFMDLASFTLPNYLILYEKDFDTEYFNTYKYYSAIYTPVSTYRKEPIIRTIYVDYIPNYYYDNFEDYKKEIMESNSEDYHVEEVNFLKDYKYEVIEIKSNGEEDKVYYGYYIFNKKDSIYFEFITYKDKDIKEFSKETLKVIKSVEFKNLEDEEDNKVQD